MYKSTTTTTTTFLILLACLSVTQSCLTFYKDSGPSGDSFVMCSSGNVPTDMNDQVSAIVVPPGWSATLFQDISYSGSSLEIKEGTWNAPQEWNDQLSSVVIQQGCPVFFQDVNLSGPSFVMCEDGNVPSGWNDKVSSIYVPNQWQVTLYIDDDFSGSSSTVSEGSTWNAPSGWNDQLSSVKISAVQLESGSTACWLNNYGRGVGKPISACSSGQEQNGALCYPTCSNGYSGVGPVCWQNCPSGFSDTGADCLKPSSYGRGAGYAIWDQDKCNNENSQGCEQNGLLYYPKCQDGFHAFGCCVCSPDCPSDMTDIGVSCQKQSYGRGAGSPLVCASGEDEDAALCYTPCQAGYSGNGPMCWSSCPSGMYQCGALCFDSQAECTSEMLSLSLKVLAGMIEIAADIENPVGVAISVVRTGLEVAEDLAYPTCDN